MQQPTDRAAPETEPEQPDEHPDEPPCPCGSRDHPPLRIGDRLSPSGGTIGPVYVCPAESANGLRGVL